MSTPNTTLEEFRLYGATFARTTQFDFGDHEMLQLRHWLDDATLRAQPHDMALWGKLVLFLANGNVTRNDKSDAQRLGNYLQAMEALSLDAWRSTSSTFLNKETAQSAYQVFHQVVSALQEKRTNQGSQILGELLENKTWNPDALLDILFSVRTDGPPEQVVPIRDSSEGLMLQALWHQMLCTKWAPSDTPRYGRMWQACNMDVSMSDPVCAGILAKSAPSHTGEMLVALLNSTNIAPDVIASFFPLRVKSCDAYAILDPLIGLLTDGGRDDLTYKAKIVAEQLRMHHPELSGLVDMHLDLFPDACEVNSLASMLVPGFNALYGRPAEPAVCIEGDFFDEPSTGAMA